MSRLIPLTLALSLTACSAPPPVPAQPASPDVPASPPSVSAPPAAPSPPPPATAPEAPQLLQESSQGIRIQAVRFHPATHRLAIADQPNGPGSLWQNAARAAHAFQGIAAINAGFFNPDGSPLGLVIAQGQRRGAVNRSSLGSGVLVTSPSPRLLRRPSSFPDQDLLQAGPFLVENGHPISGLNASRNALRSVVACDSAGFWYLIQTGSCTLDQAARALAAWSPCSRSLTSALNLDGGRSCDLWASPSLSGGLHQQPLFANPVRNFLVLIPKNLSP